MKGLTPRQREVLNAIKKFTSENQFPPTIRELCAMLDIKSPRGMAKHIDALQKKGYVRKTHGHRSIIAPTGVPILGRVTAGLKTIAIEDIEGYVELDNLASDPDCFALRVKGDSMEQAGIFEGDLLIVNPTLSRSHGDIVVAVVGDMATVKKLVKLQNQTWWLEPANPKYEPIPVRDDTIIVGKVVAVLRRY